MAHYDLGNAFALSGLWPDAVAQYEAALRIDPGSVAAHYNLGNTLLKMPGRLPDAIDQYQEALRLEPNLAPAREMLERLQHTEP
jgi:tetratricopeptide (TPR) repeat protein